MAMDKISKTNVTQKPIETKKKTNTNRANEKQEELASRLIDPPRNVSDLKSNAKIKQQQFLLAQQSGDTDLAKLLQKELNQINEDIERSETSIFDNKKQK